MLEIPPVNPAARHMTERKNFVLEMYCGSLSFAWSSESIFGGAFSSAFLSASSCSSISAMVGFFFDFRGEERDDDDEDEGGKVKRSIVEALREDLAGIPVMTTGVDADDAVILFVASFSLL